MKKTTKKKLKVVADSVPTVESPVHTAINLLSVGFGQEDLNKVVDKINEIIVNLNSVL